LLFFNAGQKLSGQEHLAYLETEQLDSASDGIVKLRRILHFVSNIYTMWTRNKPIEAAARSYFDHRGDSGSQGGHNAGNSQERQGGRDRSRNRNANPQPKASGSKGRQDQGGKGANVGHQQANIWDSSSYLSRTPPMSFTSSLSDSGQVELIPDCLSGEYGSRDEKRIVGWLKNSTLGNHKDHGRLEEFDHVQVDCLAHRMLHE